MIEVRDYLLFTLRQMNIAKKAMIYIIGAAMSSVVALSCISSLDFAVISIPRSLYRIYIATTQVAFFEALISSLFASCFIVYKIRFDFQCTLSFY